MAKILKETYPKTFQEDTDSIAESIRRRIAKMRSKEQ